MKTQASTIQATTTATAKKANSQTSRKAKLSPEVKAYVNLQADRKALDLNTRSEWALDAWIKVSNRQSKDLLTLVKIGQVVLAERSLHKSDNAFGEAMKDHVLGELPYSVRINTMKLAKYWDVETDGSLCLGGEDIGIKALREAGVDLFQSNSAENLQKAYAKLEKTLVMFGKNPHVEALENPETENPETEEPETEETEATESDDGRLTKEQVLVNLGAAIDASVLTAEDVRIFLTNRNK